jgi:hypothetical protein
MVASRCTACGAEKEHHALNSAGAHRAAPLNSLNTTGRFVISELNGPDLVCEEWWPQASALRLDGTPLQRH